jgi:hypothetical protein
MEATIHINFTTGEVTLIESDDFKDIFLKSFQLTQQWDGYNVIDASMELVPIFKK